MSSVGYNSLGLCGGIFGPIDPLKHLRARNISTKPSQMYVSKKISQTTRRIESKLRPFNQNSNRSPTRPSPFLYLLRKLTYLLTHLCVLKNLSDYGAMKNVLWNVLKFIMKFKRVYKVKTSCACCILLHKSLHLLVQLDASLNMIILYTVPSAHFEYQFRSNL